MLTPNFTDPQFVDAAGQGGLNTAFGSVSGSMAGLASGLFTAPGLIAPESMALSYTGFTGTVTLSPPWALITSGGVHVSAHGAQTGQDTQTYSFDFTSLVPGTGSVSGWLACSGITIQQGVVSIPGPPPGHPSWNPNFVPTIGYSTNVYSVAVFPTTTQPDNRTTFGLFSTTLTAGGGGLANISNAAQPRAGLLTANQLIGVSAGTLTPAQAQFILIPNSNGQTNTLPYATNAKWLTFRFLNNLNSTWTVAAQSTDGIAGLNDTGFAASVTLNPYDFVDMYAAGGNWYIDGTLAQRQVYATRNTNASGYVYATPTGQSTSLLRMGGLLQVPYNGGNPNTYNFPRSFTTQIDGMGTSFIGPYPQPWGAGITAVGLTQFNIYIPSAGSSEGPTYGLWWWAEGT